jgi:hypothetical protein
MSRSRTALLAPLVLGLVLLAGPSCKSNPADVVSGGFEDMIEGIEDWVGGGNLPGEHLQELRSVHEPGTWRLRTDVEGALETARDSVRALGETDLATWRDAGIVAQILSSIATDHTASLVRVEALDTMERIAPWTLQAETEPEFAATEEAVIDALKVVREAQGKDDVNPAFTAEVLNAVRALSNFRFDEGATPRPEAALTLAARRYSGKLRNARGVLTALTGSTLEGFRADPEIRDEMDRAYISLSASVIRATFAAALTGDANSLVRATAADHAGDLQLSGAPAELARSLRDDVSSSVRRASATALGQFPMEEAVPGLLEGLYDDMPDVRGATARALTATTGQSFGTDRGAWRRWWQSRSASPTPDPEADTGTR